MARGQAIRRSAVYLLNNEYCPVAQSGEHRADNSEVVGSKPTWTTKQWPHRLWVRSLPFQGGELGSSPSGATKIRGGKADSFRSESVKLVFNREWSVTTPPHHITSK